MTIISRTLTVGLVASIVGAIAVADEAPQIIKAGALSFKAPSTWKKETPSNLMRKAQLKVEPVAGDSDPAELAVTAFPGGAGGVEANVERWEKQFLDANKSIPKAKVEKKKGMNVDVTRVEVSGRLVSGGAAQSARVDKPNYRLLGAIVLTPETGYFFKLTGPEKTIAEATKGFDAMVESMKVDN